MPVTRSSITIKEAVAMACECEIPKCGGYFRVNKRWSSIPDKAIKGRNYKLTEDSDITFVSGKEGNL